MPLFAGMLRCFLLRCHYACLPCRYCHYFIFAMLAAIFAIRFFAIHLRQRHFRATMAMPLTFSCPLFAIFLMLYLFYAAPLISPDAAVYFFAAFDAA